MDYMTTLESMTMAFLGIFGQFLLFGLFVFFVMALLLRWILGTSTIISLQKKMIDNQEKLLAQLDVIDSTLESNQSEQVVDQLKILNSKIKIARPAGATPKKIQQVISEQGKADGKSASETKPVEKKSTSEKRKQQSLRQGPLVLKKPDHLREYPEG